MLKNNNLTFPENIMKDIFDDTNIMDKDEFINNFINISKKMFTVMEQEALKNRYIYNLDLRQIGAKFNVSYEWARLKFKEMKDKLSQPEILKYLKNGIIPSKTPIEFLKLTLRSYNGLVENNFHFAEDITTLSYDDLASLPKVGIKCADEIITSLNDFGYDTKYLRHSQKVVDSIRKFMRTHNLSKNEIIKYIDLI